MEDTSISKMILNTKPEGICGVGRPKLRWLNDVQFDIKTLGKKKKMETKCSKQKRMDGISKGD